MEVVGRYAGKKEKIGHILLCFDVEVNALEGQVLNKNENYALTINKYRPKRSKNANAYYQELSTKIAHEMGISATEYHNRTLAELGIMWRDDEGKRDYILHKDGDWWLKVLKGENHYMPTEAVQDTKSGQFRWYVRLKPSRDFDTKEMSTLLDYVIQDAGSIGISVLTPQEIKEMKDAWESR